MKKNELLKIIDDSLLERLYRFSYGRTRDSYEANDLCSDIIYAIVRSANAEGEITDPYAFIWKVAHNVYADFCKKRKIYCDNMYLDDPDSVLPFIAEENEDDDDDLIKKVWEKISYLTRAYREVMIAYYIDGIPILKIAEQQSISESAVKQRLFAARQKLKKEVEEMKEALIDRPVALSNIDYVIWGTGSPAWGDPRNVITRTFSNHVIWLCHRKPSTATEIANELNVPTVYVEEELDILTQGANGKYGALRKLDNGRYAINFVLFDVEAIERLHTLYTEQLPEICDKISEHIEKHREEYLNFPYLNKVKDLNLILWQQVSNMAHSFVGSVEYYLEKNHFNNMKEPERPFSIFGYVDNGKSYGGGWDGINASNICGMSCVHFDNIYISRIKKHFSCGHNVSTDPLLQMAIMAIDGISTESLDEKEKEHAAKAIECGYLMREGNMLYTKILVHDAKDSNKLFNITNRLRSGVFDKDAENIASRVAEAIKSEIPEYLHNEWRYANSIASIPIIDALVEALIDKGIMTPPEDGIGAEGCWFSITK